MKEFKHDKKPQRLSKIIAEQYPLLSYNAIVRLIKDKEVRVDGEKVAEDIVVNTGSIVRCYAKDGNLKTVYEDGNILVAYKPKGIASEGDNSAESVVRQANDGVILCHRLDTNTDGLLMFAKNQKVADEIDAAFKSGFVVKNYRAHVYGRIAGDTVYDDYLVKDADEGKVTVFHDKRAGATPIKTAVKVVGYDGDTTFLEVSIRSGKTHQIRAQLAAHGHFILGDGKYGRDDINRKYKFKKQQLTANQIIFGFPPDSFLYYLNSQEIAL